jgi:ubiquinone/menaquinone biosynthesis C-methylase UbiE
MSAHRDVGAFGDRAAGYEQGWLGRMHHDIASQAARLILSLDTTPQRVLDVGCGTGYLLRLLARMYPHSTALAGIDPASFMIELASTMADDERLRERR